jgi:hypothetical protein
VGGAELTPGLLGHPSVDGRYRVLAGAPDLIGRAHEADRLIGVLVGALTGESLEDPRALERLDAASQRRLVCGSCGLMVALSAPGEPQLDVRGLSSLDENDQLGLWHDGGSITFVDNGTSGSLSSDWIDDDTGTTVHSEVTWEGCGGV